MSKTKLIRTIYLYLFSLVGLVLIIIAGVRFIDMGLKAWIFTEADRSEYRFEIAPKRFVEDGTPVAEELSEEEQIARQDKLITQQRQRNAANSLAMLIIGVPLYLYHWRLAYRRKEDE